MKRRSTRLVPAAAATLILPLALTTGVPTASAAPGDITPKASGPVPVQTKQLGRAKASPRADRLGQHDRELLAKAERKGAKRVTVILATEKKGRPQWPPRSARQAAGPA